MSARAHALKPSKTSVNVQLVFPGKSARGTRPQRIGYGRPSTSCTCAAIQMHHYTGKTLVANNVLPKDPFCQQPTPEEVLRKRPPTRAPPRGNCFAFGRRSRRCRTERTSRVCERARRCIFARKTRHSARGVFYGRRCVPTVTTRCQLPPNLRFWRGGGQGAWGLRGAWAIMVRRPNEKENHSCAVSADSPARPKPTRPR